MAQIDVTDLLSDPDFVDILCLVTRKPSINSFGENILQEVSVSTVGCVQPASGRVIQRIPESLRVSNMSSFWLKGEIIASAPGKYSSIIVFKGKRFQVQTVFDWTNWGQGYTEGVCVAEVPA
jgi:galactose-6-phosphate isomerase